MVANMVISLATNLSHLKLAAFLATNLVPNIGQIWGRYLFGAANMARLPAGFIEKSVQSLNIFVHLMY